MCNIPWGTIGKFITGSLPLVIAVVVAYIAWAQYSINRRQYRLALFEKRIAIYNAVTSRCATVVSAMASELEDNIKFLRATRDNDFLFGPEVHAFIDQIWKQGNNLHTCQQTLQQPLRAQRESEIVEWFSVQISEARKLFFKYMDFTDDY